MKSSTELFELIHSLEGGEKGYFKRYSLIKSREDKNYLLLFDAIAKQSEYDEKKLQEKFRQYPFTRQFAVAKSYLHERILKALDSCHTSEQQEIRSRLHHVEIYFKKGLYDQALKAVSKAKVLAIRYDLYYFLPQILHSELTIQEQKYDVKRMQEILLEYDEMLALLKNIQVYRSLSARIGFLSEQYRKSAIKKHLTQLKKLMDQPELKQEKNALSFIAKIYFYSTHANYCIAEGNTIKAQEWFIKALSLFQNSPEKIISKFPGYLSLTANLLELCAESREYQHILSRLETIKSATSGIRNRSHRSRSFFVYHYHMLDYLEKTGQFDKAEKLIPGVLKEYGSFEKELSDIEKILLQIKIAFSFFGAGHYSKCLKHINIIRNELSISIRPDIERFVTLFYIIVHFEIRHEDLLPHLIQSAYRFLNRNEHCSQFELMVMSFFRTALLRDNTDKTLITSFEMLKKKLLPLTQDTNEKHAFHFFDYISWLESKIENRSFAEIVSEKAEKEKNRQGKN